MNLEIELRSAGRGRGFERSKACDEGRISSTCDLAADIMFADGWHWKVFVVLVGDRKKGTPNPPVCVTDSAPFLFLVPLLAFSKAFTWPKQVTTL